MVEERIKQIIEQLDEVDPLVTQRILHAMGKNEALEATYIEISDDFGKIFIVECPSCGGNLQFERADQKFRAYNLCYLCGQKLKKKESENDIKSE